MFGYIKLASAVPPVRPGDCGYNGGEIQKHIKSADEDGVKLLVFPELSICGYTCGDLFFQSSLIEACEKEIARIVTETAGCRVVSIIGAPVLINGGLYNCAIVISGGRILGIVPKTILSQSGETNENRWFKSGNSARVGSVLLCGQHVPFGKILFNCVNYKHFMFAAEICSDLWSVQPPSGIYAIGGAKIIANLSASPCHSGKSVRRRVLVAHQSDKCMCAYVYSSSGIGESSSDAVFDGHSIIAASGVVLAEGKRFLPHGGVISSEVDVEAIEHGRIKSGAFSDSIEHIDVSWLVTIKTVDFSINGGDSNYPQTSLTRRPYIDAYDREVFLEDAFNIQTFGLYKRLEHTGIKKTILGVSGGLDSTLALLAAANCHDKMGISRKNIIGVTMPGFGTSPSTRGNAAELMEALEITSREISIKEACELHFKDLQYDASKRDAVFENAQARERTQILMDLANMENGLVVGTGGMSELALGWATYNGDHMSMYGVNAGLPKTVIRMLLRDISDRELFGGRVSAVLNRILDTPVSPELLPANERGEISQKTEDLVGPYELHDYFLYCLVQMGFSREKTLWLACKSFEGAYEASFIEKCLDLFYRRFFSQQFKRSCSPDSPKVIEFGVSQRTDLNIPSDISGTLWIK